jgi:uncharacterized delta-60 repeat protein
MRDRTNILRAALAFVIAAVFAVPTTAAATTGALDTSLGNDGFASVAVGAQAAAAATVVQPNRDIVTAGQTWLGSGQTEIVVTRMTPDGQLDPSFGDGGIATVPIGNASGLDSGAALALQPDGKIVAAGTGQANGKLEFAAVRLDTNGTPDPTFGSNGVALVSIGATAIANAVAIQPNGDVVLGGSAASGRDIYFAAARLTPSGVPDPSFGSNGVAFLTGQPPGAAWGMVLQPSGGIVLAGATGSCTTCQSSYMAMRLTQNGSLDRTFAQNGVFANDFGGNATGLASALAPNGDTLITGIDQTSRGSKVVTVALTPSGALDPSFGSRGVASFAGSGVNAMAVDSSGRIDLAGVGASIVRLEPNGSLDTSFSGGVGFYCNTSSCAANGIALDPTNGYIVLSGATVVNGAYEILVLRVAP